jgi:hypothetical protein
MNSRHQRSILATAIPLLILVLLVGACSKKDEATGSAAPPPPTVVVERIDQRTVRSTSEYVDRRAPKKLSICARESKESCRRFTSAKVRLSERGNCFFTIDKRNVRR